MSTSKHIDRVCILAIIAALLISILFMNGASLGIQAAAQTMGYEDRLFDTSRVHTIDIVMDDWDTFVQTAASEEYAVCSVVIDGEAFHNVGIRGKGNTSLRTVSTMDSERYSFKIEFDQYDSTKTYHGLDKLSLNNLIQDNTMMKDYLVYQMMNAFGVAAPLCSYVYITVNGADWGLYLAVEAVEESFLQRNYGSHYGQLYKPDSTDLGGGRGNGRDFDFESLMASPEADPSGGAGPEMPAQGGMDRNGNMGGGMGMGSSDTRLQYTDDQISSYAAIFDNAKTAVTSADRQRLIASLKALSEGSDPEAVLFAEDVIRYFVVHNYVVNADSYTGSMIHNYYLYEQDGRLAMIPWDYNLAFGTFQGGSADSMVNDAIDSPLSVTGSGRPMIDWIFAGEESTDLYHRYFREFLDTVDPAAIIAQAKALIAPYVEKDPTKFCTYAEFETGVDTLEAFCALRSQSVARQLEGEEGTVDASGITLSDMGAMSHESGGDSRQPGQSSAPQMPGLPGNGPSGAGVPPGGDPQFPGFGGQGGMQSPGGMEGMGPGQGRFPAAEQTASAPVPDSSPWLWLAAAAVILTAGLVFAVRFKR